MTLLLRWYEKDLVMIKKKKRRRNGLKIASGKPRGDATPVKKIKGKYMPIPYGPSQKYA